MSRVFVVNCLDLFARAILDEKAISSNVDVGLGVGWMMDGRNECSADQDSALVGSREQVAAFTCTMG